MLDQIAGTFLAFFFEKQWFELAFPLVRLRQMLAELQHVKEEYDFVI